MINETTNSKTFGQKIKAKVDKALANSNVRFGLTLVVIGAGAYFGTGRPMKQIATSVKRIDGNIYETGKFLGDAYGEQMEFRQNCRDAITDMIMEDKGFTHFPGLGVLDHNFISEMKAKEKEKAA